MSENLSMGLGRLLKLGEELKGFHIGKVVESGTDSMGRIKVRILSLFGDEIEGIPNEDLPWIQMMPSTGMYVIPEEGEFVTVIFQGSIYEGFYIGQTVSKKGIDKGECFLLNFHNFQIYGNYDGSNVRIAAFAPGQEKASVTLEMNGWTGELDVLTDFSVNIQSPHVSVLGEEGVTIGVDEGDINLNVGKGKLITNATTVVPMLVPGSNGPWCALPICPFCGLAHNSNIAT